MLSTPNIIFFIYLQFLICRKKSERDENESEGDEGNLSFSESDIVLPNFT